MSQMIKVDPVPWYLWPFWAIWRFFTWIISLTGRLIAVSQPDYDELNL
jgi:hypothetical protein